MIKFIGFLFGLTISILGGHILSEKILEKLRKDNTDITKPAGRNKNGDNYNWLLGCLERFVYTMALIMNFEWFIGVWLGMKGIGRWTGNKDYGVLLRGKDDKSNIIEVNHARAAVVNIFLIGNLISLIAAAVGAYIIKITGIDCLSLF
ncbi:MAG: hypothetical protein KAS66_07285 [Candidatus Omnitrophica bacterium]|nr:hypothetical protein [Candidatus Omnitrophota bacterium]